MKTKISATLETADLAFIENRTGSSFSEKLAKVIQLARKASEKPVREFDVSVLQSQQIDPKDLDAIFAQDDGVFEKLADKQSQRMPMHLLRRIPDETEPGVFKLSPLEEQLDLLTKANQELMAQVKMLSSLAQAAVDKDRFMDRLIAAFRSKDTNMIESLAEALGI